MNDIPFFSHYKSSCLPQYRADETGKACIDNPEEQGDDGHDDNDHRRRSQGLLPRGPGHLLQFNLNLPQKLDRLVDNGLFLWSCRLADRRVGLLDRRRRHTHLGSGVALVLADVIHGSRFFDFLG
ncbi:hypothetical protein DESC_610173 [Desulfosarcina cetonica]|nr:hypothetical protein DESC_610173 [Desulfosarcina cetonica]